MGTGCKGCLVPGQLLQEQQLAPFKKDGGLD